MTRRYSAALRRLPGLAALAAATQLSLAASPALAQGRCFQVVDYVAPDLLRCQQIGEDYLRRPIWLCCP